MPDLMAKLSRKMRWKAYRGKVTIKDQGLTNHREEDIISPSAKNMVITEMRRNDANLNPLVSDIIQSEYSELINLLQKPA